MEIRTLKYFLTIAREESILGAAEYLHITQPTLSRQMKDLEERLGKQLFLRGKRKITLTKDGMLLRRRAEEIISLVERTETEVMADEELLTGNIGIGVTETNGMRFIAKTINTMQKEHPYVKFHIFSGTADEIRDQINTGNIDFGIVIEPINLTEFDYIKLPIHNVWGVLMKSDSPLAQLEKITVEDLRDRPLLCSSQSMVKNEISGWIAGNERKLNIVGTYNLPLNASLIVEESNCYALCLDNIINVSGTSKLCYRLLEPKLEANVVIIWKKYQILSKITEYFLETIQNKIKESIVSI